MAESEEFILASAAASQEFASKLAAALKQSSSLPCRILLQGELGTGKTTLCRALLTQLGYQGVVRSPSYTLVESYKTPYFPVHHLDAYRLKAGEERELGLEDYLADKALILIEWPERISRWLSADLKVSLSFNKNLERIGNIRSCSATGERICNKLSLASIKTPAGST